MAAALRADAESLALALKRLPPAERLRALADRSRPGSFEHELAIEVLAASDGDAKVAAVNLALSEIDHALCRRASWPPTALRLALLVTGILAFLAYITDTEQLRWPLSIVGVGAFAAFSCAHAARVGARDTDRQRRAVDAIVAATLALPPEPSRDGAGHHPSAAAARARRRRPS